MAHAALAVNRGHHDNAQVLIAGGADVNVRTSDSRTAISIARNEAHGNILEFLQKADIK